MGNRNTDMQKRKAIFLDKDGTLIKDVPYNADPAKIELLAGVAEGLMQLGKLGYAFFVITNQAGVAKGYFSEEALAFVEGRLRQLLQKRGIALSGFYYCPHHPEGTVRKYTMQCRCRKPMPGMLLRAASKYGINLGESWMVGDILDDVEAGNRAGCKTVLIDGRQYERTKVLDGYRHPAFIVNDFKEATALILNDIQNGKV